MAVFSVAFILQCSEFLLFAPINLKRINYIISLFKIYIYMQKTDRLQNDTYYYDY